MLIKPFTLKLKNLQVLEAGETIFRGYIYTIGLLGLAFGEVKIVNLNTLEITYNGYVNKIRVDEQFGYNLDFAQVVIEDLQARLKVRHAELLDGGEAMLKRVAGFENIEDVFSRENTYSASGVTLNFRKVAREGRHEMEMRLKSEYQNFSLVTLDKGALLITLASTARAFTKATYRQYAMPDKRWNHNTNAPVNPKEYADIQKGIPEEGIPKGKTAMIGAMVGANTAGLTAALVANKNAVEKEVIDNTFDPNDSTTWNDEAETNIADGN